MDKKSTHGYLEFILHDNIILLELKMVPLAYAIKYIIICIKSAEAKYILPVWLRGLKKI